jgi:2-dehydro-3-deoxyphosphogluconate aldolase/(4S)-4-hydroxy-2-oxoglutarate aldolase
VSATVSQLPGARDESLLLAQLRRARIVAVVTVDDVADAAPLAGSLTAGGITAVELALRTPAALAALREFRTAAPGVLLGAGTVLLPEQADAARAAGADFALAPGLDVATARHCGAVGLPFVPGVATASDIQAALREGFRLLKWFPAEPLGGARGLRALAAPFAHFGVRYLPLGGIDEAKALAYLADPMVAAVGGSWIAPSEMIRAREWDAIRSRAAAAVALAGGTFPAI